MEETTFVNKVAQSGIITLDLLNYAPQEQVLFLDIKDFLFMEMIVKESEFKKMMEAYDWEVFKDKVVAVGCSTEAIIPTWVYLVIGSKLHGLASRFDYSDVAAMKLQLWKELIRDADFSPFSDKKVVVRANALLDPSLYLLVTDKLKPIVKTLMFGEAGLPKVIYKKM